MFANPGDILLYRKDPSVFDGLVDEFEEMEYRKQKEYFYHVGIALNNFETIEADGRYVEVNPIDYERADIFRPPINQQSINYALGEIRKYIGQSYDWILILDDALRYLTRNLIHLPVRYIRSRERHAKVCSTLVAKYLGYAGWGPLYGLNVSPQDLWFAIKDYEVVG